MYFFRSTRVLIAALTVLIPAAARTVRPEEHVDSVTDLVQKIEADKIVLNYDESNGYLRSLLKQLHVPISSQVLVFSKSSFQLSQIRPEAPRAIYFNDDVYVGWVNHGQFIEVAEVDAQSGPAFYKLSQEYDPYPVIHLKPKNALSATTRFRRILLFRDC